MALTKKQRMVLEYLAPAGRVIEQNKYDHWTNRRPGWTVRDHIAGTNVAPVDGGVGVVASITGKELPERSMHALMDRLWIDARIVNVYRIFPERKIGRTQTSARQYFITDKGRDALAVASATGE